MSCCFSMVSILMICPTARKWVGFYRVLYEKECFNPKLNRQEKTERRWINLDLELPKGDQYSKFVKELIRSTQL
jgi:hypothetical protein